jgi:hypothetical protein
MKQEIALLCLQVPVAEPNPEPDESNLHVHPRFIKVKFSAEI